MKHRKRSLTPILTTIVVLAFFYLPLVVLFVESFNDSKFGGAWCGFTTKWYSMLWGHRPLQEALVISRGQITQNAIALYKSLGGGLVLR